MDLRNFDVLTTTSRRPLSDLKTHPKTSPLSQKKTQLQPFVAARPRPRPRRPLPPRRRGQAGRWQAQDQEGRQQAHQGDCDGEGHGAQGRQAAHQREDELGEAQREEQDGARSGPGAAQRDQVPPLRRDFQVEMLRERGG